MATRVWMIDNAGGSSGVDPSLVEKRTNDGWQLIRPKDLDHTGNPKQMYYPQFDRNNKTEYLNPIEMENMSVKDVLTTEIF